MGRPKTLPAAFGGLALVLGAGSATAGGYDTPVLYSARHQGMGGTAIGFVNDPASVFHNPAGLGRVHGATVLADISLLTGSITSSPGSPDLPDAEGIYPSRTSEPLAAPLFLVGGAYRIGEPLTIGLALYPVASAAGEYHATSLVGNPTIDKTRLVFIEASPAVSVTLLEGLHVGAGYRATFVTLERVKGNADDPQEFDFTVSGVDLLGFRAGVQWQATDYLDLGFVYRHKISPELTADEVTAAFLTMTDARTSLTLPTKLGFGASTHFSGLRLAADVEYGLYGQNDKTTLSAYNAGQDKTEEVTNYFEWQNAITGRFGVEYGLGPEHDILARTGYVFDGKVGNKAYPSAFGTPPAPSHSISIGAGYRKDTWQVNLAGVYRFVDTDVTVADVADAEPCATCSKPGTEYSLNMLGAYVDFSIDFEAAPLF